MAERRITEENPIREDVEGLDYERCAALHNHIVERGWTERGLNLADLDRTTWWDFHKGDNAFTKHVERLEPTVIAFLKLAWDEFYDEHRYIALHHAMGDTCISHPLGLHLSIWDADVTMNGRQPRVKFETVLETFLEMMDCGKIVAVSDSYRSQQERQDPWIMPSYTEDDLKDSLAAFSALITAIEVRMPSPPRESDYEVGLLDPADKATFGTFPPRSFARRFLERARRPRFRYLAPGLQLAWSQPLASVTIEDDMLRPILLFQSSELAHRDTADSMGRNSEFFPVSNCPAGLFLTETKPYEWHPWEDGCMLLLPFTIGENGWARKSNGELMGEHRQDEGENPGRTPCSTDLFQLGHNVFIRNHNVQLKNVLWLWTEMVEEGMWEVDSDGIKGGMEKWKEADTEEHWEDYVLPLDW
ncbi:uncharacterized protein K489DRAFT_386428 [Dissoconium aciculare CBS 342.82]|uniref:Uncharacterized protein n=1 Tax=Dissoconium aciculare CBS 342.82 TaxID=1314786 RepID=A0A6J3ME48_9PEZI|nr:uncharacterized protein K489DRAFT_386428 [Dissoconium aciculare CBS 342.82]KAF1825884.1 hypothetical protein K489DRAFT_386428 [Dissoconium aciculare CBS 342.82]